MIRSNPPQRFLQALNKLLSIPPGERKKSLLLYILFFVFWLGLRWGGTASETLFLDQWSAADLSLMFVGNAALAFTIGLVYNSFADRVSNERLLLVLLGLTMVWLVSVQLLLLSDAHNGEGALVYAYFYLAFLAVADITSLHTLNYISEFYDIRTAKRALPLLLSAGFTGAIVSGFSIRYISARYVPLAWMACLVVMMAFVYLIRRWLPQEVRRVEQLRQASYGRRHGESGLENLRAGFRFVIGSSLLRWLALSTLVLVVLMKLLNFEASQVFTAKYQGEALKRLYGDIDWISNLVGLILPSLAFRPMLSRLGVGTTNLFFPVVTLLSVVLLGYLPGRGTAVIGRLTDRMIKKVFRNPADAMLYNSVPLNVKGRARGFINGLVVPLGSLIAGLMLLAMQAKWLTLGVLTALGVLLGMTYVFLSLRVREAYGHALAELLAEDELSVFRAATQADLTPATLDLLYAKLESPQNDHVTIFLAELLYDVQGHKALGRLGQLARRGSPQVRANIIRMVSATWIGDPGVRQLCLAGLSDPAVSVRRAAAMALAESRDAVQHEALLNAFLKRLSDPNDAVRASVIPPLMASGDFHYLAPAVSVLSVWLSPRASSQRRALGLRVLFKLGDERMARTLTRYLNDPAPLVREQAAELVGELSARSPRKAFRRWGVDTLRVLLADNDVGVRLATVNSLGRVRGLEASRVLLVALGDHALPVRRRACAVMPIVIRRKLERMLDGDDARLSESAAFLLSRVRRGRVTRQRAAHRIHERIEELVANAYRLRLQGVPLQAVDKDGMRLLSVALREEADKLIEHALWLASTFSDASKTQAIWQSLRGEDPLVQANAVETLEAVTSPRVARLVAPLYDGTALSRLAQIGQDTLDLPLPTRREVFCRAWPQLAHETPAPGADQDTPLAGRRAWLTAIAMYALLEMSEAGLDDDEGLSPSRIRAAARATLGRSAPVAQETGRLILARLDSKVSVVERPMLTTIEKAIFLAQVPVFQKLSVDELRILADISEEVTYAAGQQIFAEGERGDALYVTVSGSVSIQRKTQEPPDAITHLATFGPRECFAEISLFDGEPYSADAVAVEPTELLLVRRSPLVALVKNHPELAMGLFQVLGQRLRRANEMIAQYQQSAVNSQ